MTKYSLGQRMSILLAKVFALSLCAALLMFMGFAVLVKDTVKSSACVYFSKATKLLSYQIGRELALNNKFVAQSLATNFEKEVKEVSPIKKVTIQISSEIPKQRWACSMEATQLKLSRSIEFGGETLGQLKGEIRIVDPAYILIPLLLIVFGLASVFYLFARYFFGAVNREIVQPLEELSSSQFDRSYEGFSDEIQDIHQKLIVSHEAVLERNQALLELKSRAELTRLAQQVSHDIRSPLAAISIVEKDLRQLSEDKRIVLRSAINRIRDIANHLLNKDQKCGQDGTIPEYPEKFQEFSAQLITVLIEEVVSEKRLQFRSSLNIDIDHQPDIHSYGLFAHIQAGEFKRALSNLINNSVEAFPNKTGAIKILLKGESKDLILEVVDNGQGIPAAILPELGQRGKSFGKEGLESGSGLGLYHARTTIESWGGKLQIDSTEGKGTTVRIRLPRTEAPKWFVEKVTLNANSRIVVVDDDASIHQIWNGRFDSLRTRDHGIRVFHFSTPRAVKNWVAEQGSLHNTLFLVDYEFSGNPESGLDLIRELKIQNSAILVTSRYEESHILGRAEKMDVRMIPKGMAGLVPFAIRECKESPDLVLIDDDLLMHATWSMAAKDRKKRIWTLSDATEFFAHADEIDQKTTVYVDVTLANGAKGEEVSRQIFELGFKNVYLATGHDQRRFSPMPWIKGIVGKDPAF